MIAQEYLSVSDVAGKSLVMCEVLGHIHKAAATSASVMVSGEPGTGRGLVARTIHACANANGAPFVAVDCNTLLPAEAERQIFGVPGNREPRAGQAPEAVYPGSPLHNALGGTIFFRHVEDLPSRVQARLATLFRDREFFDQQSGDALPFTARPIAAVDIDFQMHIDDGRVRRDLHRRIAECRIALPPLRERREDIPALAQFFLTRACRDRDTPDKALDRGAQAVLAAMPWHGNSRELRDLLDSLVQATPDRTISLQALLDSISLGALSNPHPAIGESLREARQRFERDYIAAVVAQHHGRIPDAAKSLGIQRTNLYRKLRALRPFKRSAATSR